ncbi:MAG: hypothetical protein JNK82_40225, partial [Myxococcaceae bacterium]|nr:hypothetical protein [Myxococcaceae bacterium]
MPTTTDKTELLARLLDALGAPGAAEVLAKRVLELALDVAGGVLGVIRLREGHDLTARAALGLDDEVTDRFTLPAATALAGMEPTDDAGVVFLSTDPQTAVWSKPMRDLALRAVYALPLRPPLPNSEASNTESLLGVIYIGAPKPLVMSTEQRAFLGTIATHACAALSKRHAIEHLEQAIRARDDLLAVVSHDLRNPLNV